MARPPDLLRDRLRPADRGDRGRAVPGRAVHADYGAELHLRYERGGGELLVTQVAAEDDDPTPPDCFFHEGTAYHSWRGPCRSARTPRGRLVTLADINQPSLVEVGDIHWER